MKRYSNQAHRTQLVAIIILLALSMSILLLVSYPNLITAQKIAQSRRPEIKEQKITRATLQITNRCQQSHYFRVSSDIKDPGFKQQTDAILIGARSTGKTEVLLDATGLKGNLKAVVECLDCKKAEGCGRDRYEVPIEMTPVNTALRSGKAVSPPISSPRFGTAVSVPFGGVTGNVQLLFTPHYVGIIPQTSTWCPVGSEHIYISMDDEDDHTFGPKNQSSVHGWTGDISRYSTGTTFGFCRVDGNQFHAHPQNNYAVLQLSDTCPAGSISFERLFDNEDDSNNNWQSGTIAPNTVYWHQALGAPNDTKMHFCFFYADPYGGLPFPNLQVPYGVFAAPSSAWFDTGVVHTDDEDDNNHDATTPSLNLDAVKFAEIIYGTDSIWEGRNTNLLVAKVANNTCANPCPYLGSYDTANCWLGQPPSGTTAFIWTTNFYYTPVNGNQCPKQGSWFDGANCFVAAIPPQTSPFIWSNMWYVAPACHP